MRGPGTAAGTVRTPGDTAPAGGRLGIDIGGTKVALRVEADGRRTEDAVLRWPSRARRAAAPAPDRVTDPVTGQDTGQDTGQGTGRTDVHATDQAADWAALAAAVRALSSRRGARPESVGVAVPATVDRAGRVVAWPGRPSWTGFDLGGALRELFPGTVVRWADDGDLAALAEARHAGRADLVYLGVGTGVGGGIVQAGRPVPGPERGSCEVGHLIIDRAGPRCDCGRDGCLQAAASGPATLRRAARLRGADVDFAALRDGLDRAEPWAEEAVEETCSALAAAAVGLTELLHPEVTLIGGGFAAGLPSFTGRVAAHARRLSRPGAPRTEIRAAALGGLSSLHGALVLARDSLKEVDS